MQTETVPHLDDYRNTSVVCKLCVDTETLLAKGRESNGFNYQVYFKLKKSDIEN